MWLCRYITYSHIYLAVDNGVAMSHVMCLGNCEGVYGSCRQDSLVETAKKMNMTISKRKLPGFTDQPHKTPAIITKETKDISSNEVRDTADHGDCQRAGYESEADACSQCAFSISNVLSAYPPSCSDQQINACWRD